MLIQAFIELIQSRTGLRIQAQNAPALEQTIQARMKVLKLTQPNQYYEYLIRAISLEKSHSNQEWQHFIQPLVIGESYFLRDKGQFQLLQQSILPELIYQRRQQAATHRTRPSLRLWSAGCSTGEEAYSLAMLIQQLIPDWQHWSLQIVGTDINADAIAFAKRGIYDSWSFRSMDDTTRSRYFKPFHGKWKLDESICSMVTFCLGNLVQDNFPNLHSSLYNMDVIVCRNVFIYFTAQSIAIVLEKFAKTLNSNGYLITGHTELHNQNLMALRIKVYPESIVYQRSEEQTSDLKPSVSFPTYVSTVAPTPVIPLPEKPISRPQKIAPPQASLEQAEQCFQKGDYAGTIAISEQIIRQNPQLVTLHHLMAIMAQAYLNLGAYEQAKHYAEKIAAIHTLSPAPYYLLAYIAREQKQCEQAKDLLKRIIYLEPTAIAAYLELSSIYAEEGNIEKATKMKATALDLMQ